jgi:hypothetical protein
MTAEGVAADLITAGTISGSMLKTSNSTNYVLVDDQFVRILENDTQKVFIGYYIDSVDSNLQPTILLGQNADNHIIQDGTFCMSQEVKGSNTAFIGLKKGFESDGITNHFPSNIVLDETGYNTINADTQVSLESKKYVRVEGPMGIDILAQDSEGKIYLNAGKFITLSFGNTISYYAGSKNVINIDNTGVYLLENTSVDGALTIWNAPGGSNWMELHSDGSTTTNSDHFTWVLGNGQYMRLDEGMGAIILRSNYTRLVLHDGDATCRIESFNGGPANLVVATVNTSSDRELKKNIEDYTTSALNEINTTPIRYYNFKEEIDGIDPKHVGIIMQESPIDVVDPRGSGVDLYAMISMAWKAIQELSTKVTELDNKLNETKTNSI